VKKEEPKDDSAIVRRQITNNSDKITRAQANLARKEQLRDNTRSRRDDAKQQLAAVAKESGFSGSISVGSGGVNSSSTNPERTKQQLTALIEQQEKEIEALEKEIATMKAEIALLEKENDELTKKL
jgi:hypothetical protein